MIRMADAEALTTEDQDDEEDEALTLEGEEGYSSMKSPISELEVIACNVIAAADGAGRGPTRRQDAVDIEVGQ